jgi:hypothetical protein
MEYTVIKATESTTPSRGALLTAGANVVRLAAASDPIISHKQLAALEFEPDQFFIGFDKDPRKAEEHEEKLRSIGIISRFAVGLLGRTKAELIEAVRSMDVKGDDEASSDNFLRYIVDARGKLEALLAFVTAFEIRIACAIANVYSEDGKELPPLPEPPSPDIPRALRRKLKI